MPEHRRWTAFVGLAPSAYLAILFWTQPRPATVSAVDTLEDVLFLSLTAVMVVGMVGSLLAKWPLVGYLCLGSCRRDGEPHGAPRRPSGACSSRSDVGGRCRPAAAVTITVWMWRTLPGDLLADRRDKS
ncbi:hypothetical protein GCM10022399_28640 [Terrabacter ginsenosidimutans]|jgi:hypothetical protein|uniref:Uncharacterized protein n=1 Tax=Terrabacter ginsenosidimutans TaxID=490575 RepID=A0ABP7DZ97_9MICO